MIAAMAVDDEAAVNRHRKVVDFEGHHSYSSEGSGRSPDSFQTTQFLSAIRTIVLQAVCKFEDRSAKPQISKRNNNTTFKIRMKK
jgi:hypothetical protein